MKKGLFFLLFLWIGCLLFSEQGLWKGTATLGYQNSWDEESRFLLGDLDLGFYPDQGFSFYLSTFPQFLLRPSLQWTWPIFRLEEDSPFQGEKNLFLDWPEAQFPFYAGDFFLQGSWVQEQHIFSLGWATPLSFKKQDHALPGTLALWEGENFLSLEYQWIDPQFSAQSVLVLPWISDSFLGPAFSFALAKSLQSSPWTWKILAGGSYTTFMEGEEAISGGEGTLGLAFEPQERELMSSFSFPGEQLAPGLRALLHIQKPRELESPLFNISFSGGNIWDFQEKGSLFTAFSLEGLLSFVDLQGAWAPFIAWKQSLEYTFSPFHLFSALQYQYADGLGMMTGELFFRFGIAYTLAEGQDLSLMWLTNNIYNIVGSPLGSFRMEWKRSF